MPLITLTTDFDSSQPYTAAVEGILLSAIPQLQISRLNDRVAAFDIIEAAFGLRNTYSLFPANTAHVVLVNLFEEEKTSLLMTSYGKHLFIVPNNGVLGLLFNKPEAKVYQLRPTVYDLYGYASTVASTLRNVFDKKAVKARETNDFIRYKLPEPLLYPDMMKAQVLSIDRFGNVIWNVSRHLFLEQAAGRQAEFATRGNRMPGLSLNYASVPAGEPCCFFNSSGWLELAVNQGNASRLLGLDKQSSLRISFH